MNKLFVVAAVLLIGIVVSGAENLPMKKPRSPRSMDMPGDMEISAAMKESHGISKRSGGGCVDRFRTCLCQIYQMKGYCESPNRHFRAWMATWCRATCGLCTPGPQVCADTYSDRVCQYYMRSNPQCDPPYQQWVVCGCPKACGLCQDTVQSTIAPPRPVTTTVANANLQLECLNNHNQHRRDHGASPLTWDQRSADFAQQKANSLYYANDGNMFHSSRRSRYWNRMLHGENLCFRTDASAQTCGDYWYDEKNDYNPTNPVASFYRDGVGHFTQMVWKATRKVGCAQSGGYFVAIYEPSGNTLSQRAFLANVQP